MKIDGYKLLSEFFSKQPGEKVIKSFPFVTVEIYHDSKLITRKRIISRLTITDKRLVIDRLGTFIIFPVIAPKAPRKFDIHDIEFIYKKVKEIEVPYEYLVGIEYDDDLKALKIRTILDHNLILVKGMNIEKKSEEAINAIEPLIKKHKHLAMR